MPALFQMLQTRAQERELPKLEEVVPERQGATETSEPQNLSISVHNKKCLCCRKEQVEMFQCSSCHSGVYCSKECQKKGWSEHKDLCAVIKQLEAHLQQVAKRNEVLEKEKVNQVYSSSVNSSDLKIAKLIGKRCSVSCLLEGKESDGLWDTGSQPGLIGFSWLKQHFPGIPIRNVSELLDPDESLVLTAANNEELDFVGYAELKFQISHSSEPIVVPFLVTKENIDQLIIGTNIMTEVLKTKDKEQMMELLEGALTDVKKKNVLGVVNVIQGLSKAADERPVVVGKNDVVVPKGRSVKVQCRTDFRGIEAGTPVLFQPSRNFDLESSLVFGEGVMLSAVGKSKFVVPVSNPGETDVVLKAKTHVGVVSAVSSLTPCPVYEQSEEKDKVKSQEVESAVEVKSEELKSVKVKQKTGL